MTVLEVTTNETHFFVTNQGGDEFSFRRSDISEIEKKNGFVTVTIERSNILEARDMTHDGANGSLKISSINGVEPTDIDHLKILVDAVSL